MNEISGDGIVNSSAAFCNHLKRFWSPTFSSGTTKTSLGTNTVCKFYILKMQSLDPDSHSELKRKDIFTCKNNFGICQYIDESGELMKALWLKLQEVAPS